MYELIIYVILGLTILWEICSNNRQRKKVEWAVYGIVAVFFLIRFNLGPDSGVYAQIFNRVVDPIRESMTSHMERNVLYTMLSYVSKIAFGEYRWLVLVQNILILGGCSYIVFRKSKNILVSLLLFVGSGMLEVFYGSGVRQGLAMTIYFMSFYLFLPKKKFVLYEIGCLIAFGFQEVALIMMPLPILYLFIGLFRKHPYRFTIFMSIISIIILYFVHKNLVDIAKHIIGIYGAAPTWTHVIAYLRDQKFSIMGIGMEIVFLVGFLWLFYLAEKVDFDDFVYFSSLVFLFSIFFYFTFSCYDLMSRVTDFIQIIILILIPELLEAIPDRKKRILSFSCVFLLNGFLLYSDINSNLNRISAMFEREYTLSTYPYVCIFDERGVSEYQVLLDRK